MMTSPVPSDEYSFKKEKSYFLAIQFQHYKILEREIQLFFFNYDYSSIAASPTFFTLIQMPAE